MLLYKYLNAKLLTFFSFPDQCYTSRICDIGGFSVSRWGPSPHTVLLPIFTSMGSPWGILRGSYLTPYLWRTPLPTTLWSGQNPPWDATTSASRTYSTVSTATGGMSGFKVRVSSKVKRGHWHEAIHDRFFQWPQWAASIQKGALHSLAANHARVKTGWISFQIISVYFTQVWI